MSNKKIRNILGGLIIMKKLNKVVLAYSGGLDTSIIIPWLKENYGCESHRCRGRKSGSKARSWTGWRKRPLKPAPANVILKI